MAFEMVKVNSDEQIKQLADMAEGIWREYFTDLIGKPQVDYMLDKFQSYNAIKEQIENSGYLYFFMESYGEIVGYTGGHIEIAENRYFLSKLYLKKENRKKGYASKAFEFLKNLCIENNLESMYLTVNKHNYDTIEVYKKKGFEVIREQEADIGSGFVMDDYVMELKVS